MKQRLVNQCVARPIVEEQALISVLKNKQIACAIDVFDIEPLPLSHPFGRWTTYCNAAYRLRIAWSLQDVLRGYRLEYSEVARQTNGREWLKGDGVMGNEGSCVALGLKAWKTKSIGGQAFGNLSSRRSCGNSAGKNRLLYLWDI